MYKKLALAVVVLILAAASVGCGDDGLPKDAAAKVGETVITKADLEARVSEIGAQIPGQTPDPETQPEEFKDFQAQVLDYLITLRVLEAKSAELGVSVTDEDVQAQLDQIKQMFGGDDQAFEDALEQQNMTLEQLLSNLRESELLNKSAEAVTKDVVVGDDEIAAYYEEHLDEFTEEENRTARHILIAPGDAVDPQAEHTDAEWEAARAEAEAARQRIVNGEDFAAVARELSEDEGSKEQGGDLGEVFKGVMVPAFEEAVFSMKAGELSQPVRTQFGYHLIKVESVNEARQLSLEEVKDRVSSVLLDESKQEAWQAWLAEAKEAIGVVIGEDYVTTTTTTGAGTTATTAAGETTTTTN